MSDDPAQPYQLEHLQIALRKFVGLKRKEYAQYDDVTLTVGQSERIKGAPWENLAQLQAYITKEFSSKNGHVEIFNEAQRIAKSARLRKSNEERLSKNQSQVQSQSQALNEGVRLRDCLMNKGAFFIDQNGDHYAKIENGGHWEVLRLDSDRFKQFAVRTWEEWVDPTKLTSQSTLTSVILSLQSKVIERRELYVRVAKQGDAIFYDLCDDQWRQVKITQDGWTIVRHSNVLFRRSGTAAPQVEPVLGGNLTDLDDFLNLEELSRLIFKSVLPSLLLPHVTRPIILPYGEEGSGKSLLSWLMKDLIDPTHSEKGSFPESVEDFQLICETEFFPLFDNIHRLPKWAEDALSRMVTGYSSSTRKLFTNKDISSTKFKRSAILNGINIPLKNSDVLQRTLLIRTRTLDENQRMSEEEFKLKYLDLKPRILGAIFTALSQILRSKPSDFNIETRLMDFGRSAASVAINSLGCDPNTFREAYATLEDEQNQIAREASPIFEPLLELAKQGWEGTTRELGQKLASLMLDSPRDVLDKIKSQSWLGSHLSRSSRQLRLAGIQWIDCPRVGKERIRKKSLKYLSTLSANKIESSINQADNPKVNSLSALDRLSSERPTKTTLKPNQTNVRSEVSSAKHIDDRNAKVDKADNKKRESPPLVIQIVGSLDRGEGAEYEKVIAQTSEEAVNTALAKGEIFEHTAHRLKVLK